MHRTYLIFGGIILSAGVLLAIVFYANQSSQNRQTISENSTTLTPTATAIPTSTITPPVSRAATDESALKNGTYTATGSYFTPEGQEQVTVTLTLSDGIITSVNTSTTASERESRQYLQLFAAGISKVVVGKKITEVTPVGRVNGASLTGDGFDKAIQSIIQQAS